MSSAYKTSSTPQLGDPCPDPSLHSHGRGSKTRDSGSRAVLGPDGKLSAANAASPLRYAKAQDLPSFPIVGSDMARSGGMAAEPERPSSTSAGRAATLAAKGSGTRDWWQPKGSETGLSAAGLAYASTKKSKTGATNGHGSTTSTPDPSSMGRDMAQAKYLKMSREMYTEHPPVAIEVEEQRKKDALRASALSMAKKIYELQQNKTADDAETAARGGYSSKTEGLVAKTLSVAYPGLQEAAQKLANDRLAKLDPDGVLAYREHYGFGRQGPTQLTAANMRTQNRALGGDDDSSDDEAQANKVREQMARFNDSLVGLDVKKRESDRASVMAAAQKRVQTRMHDMDERVFNETGKVPPSIREEWEASARAKATENSEQRMLTHGKVHIGGGKYMDQSEINAIALARIQPTLDELTAAGQKQRERDEEIRLAQIERKKELDLEKQKQNEEKSAAKKKRDEEKLKAYQIKHAEKMKMQEERAEMARLKAEEKIARDKAIAEEKAERDRINAERKAEEAKLKAEEKVERERVQAEEKAERERLKAQEKEEERLRVEAQKEKDRQFKAEQAETAAAEEVTTEKLSTEEPVTFVEAPEEPTDVVTATEPITEGVTLEKTTTGGTLEAPTVEGGFDADAVQDLPPEEPATSAREIAERALEEPVTAWPTYEESNASRTFETGTTTPGVRGTDAVVPAQTEAVVEAPSALADEPEEETKRVIDDSDDDVSPGREIPGTAAATEPVSALTTTTSATPSGAAKKESRRRSFFNRFRKRTSKASQSSELKPVVKGDPTVGPSIVGAKESESVEPASLVTETPADSENVAESSAVVGGTTNGVAEHDDAESGLYSEPSEKAKGKQLERAESVSSLSEEEDEAQELRGRKSYSSNEQFEEAKDHLDEDLQGPETPFAREHEGSPARSASKFQEEL